MGRFDDWFQYPLMEDIVESSSEYFRNIVTKDIGHQNICIFSITHVHRERYVTNNVKVGIKKFKACMKSVYFKLFTLFSVGFSE
jgi:hypothetical protein